MSATDTRPGCHDETCACPACAGLRTFVRPRFFAGQLLTETELTALQGYVVDKDKLHNRYLHGHGVVCGLQVECDDCGPGVLVRPGYALDQCGADLVLPEAVRVDVVRLVEACTRPTTPTDCDPPRVPSATGCDDREQSWCLWMRYVEKPGRQVAPLGGSARASCSRCSDDGGCPGGSDCGRNGGSSTGRDTCGCSRPRTTTTTRSAECEPSRVSELVEFGVAGRDGCCDDDLSDRVAGTFPAKVVDCITALRPVLTSGMTPVMQRQAMSAVAGAPIRGDDSQVRAAICTLYQNVVDLYRRDPLRTTCRLPEGLTDIDCSPFDPDLESELQYRTRMVAAVQALLQLVLLYLRDCLCAALLPPCPPGCDDRVMLACVTVRDGTVVRVCNLSCRRYAGSFVNREYWLPIGPVLSWLAALACCFPIPARGLVRVPDGQDQPDGQGRGGSARRPVFGTRTVFTERYDGLMSMLRTDDFALGRLWRARVAGAARRFNPIRALHRAQDEVVTDGDTVMLASLLHTDAAGARAQLAKRGVTAQVVEVADRADALVLDLVPRARRGGSAVLYVLDGRVVGVGGAGGAR